MATTMARPAIAYIAPALAGVPAQVPGYIYVASGRAYRSAYPIRTCIASPAASSTWRRSRPASVTA